MLWFLQLGRDSKRTRRLGQPSEGRLDSVELLVQALERDLPAAIVRFQAVPGKRQIRAPETWTLNGRGIHQEDLSCQNFEIVGRFDILADLQLRFPRWGNVRDFVAVSAHHLDGNELRLLAWLAAAREKRSLPFPLGKLDSWPKPLQAITEKVFRLEHDCAFQGINIVPDKKTLVIAVQSLNKKWSPYYFRYDFEQKTWAKAKIVVGAPLK